MFRSIVRPVAGVAAAAGVGTFVISNAAQSTRKYQDTLPQRRFAAPAALTAGSPVKCHCQVPCGIFHDHGRVSAILEDAQTIRKAVAQAQELHKTGKLQDTHQMVRWIMTKEEHAAKIMTTIAEYFLAQKVKKELLSEHDYHTALELHHAVMVAAMKTKQSSEMAAVDALDKAIAALRPMYEQKK
eukprot:TRINITY_DN72075_c0_g1_i1.p2 TRINITY_DN72075_c0_g1~~TRINITY_DN72075_c0_g1_i1.p2  ORF type:complete len:205 (-),score=58.76 TRINITY_DN72075_c0_g1_i1:311-865(-)